MSFTHQRFCTQKFCLTFIMNIFLSLKSFLKNMISFFKRLSTELCVQFYPCLVFILLDLYKRKRIDHGARLVFFWMKRFLYFPTFLHWLYLEVELVLGFGLGLGFFLRSRVGGIQARVNQSGDCFLKRLWKVDNENLKNDRKLLVNNRALIV